MAEEWGVCGAGLTCASSEQLLLRYRGVWCADVVAWNADRHDTALSAARGGTRKGHLIFAPLEISRLVLEALVSPSCSVVTCNISTKDNTSAKLPSAMCSGNSPRHGDRGEFQGSVRVEGVARRANT